MRNKIFSALILVLLIGAIGIFVLPQDKGSKNEKRDLIRNEDLVEDITIDNVETLLQDQFYGREALTSLYNKVKLELNDVPYKAIAAYRGFDSYYKYLNDNAILLENGYMCKQVLVYDDDKLAQAQRRGYNINEMDLKYPDIKTYVYFPTSIEEVLEIKDSDTNINYGLGYRQAFASQLNENIKYWALGVANMYDYANYFYKSDIHWTAYGAYQGYADIINLMNNDFNLGEVKEVDQVITYDYLWSGDEIGHVGPKDQIIDMTLKDIPEGYDYYINGELSEYGSGKQDYAINGNTSIYSDYDWYFGNNVLEKRFEFHDETKPNLLVFCDSFNNVNQQWIASHFNTTVFIDLRADDGSFSLDEIINKYDIDAILVCQIYSNLYFNGNETIPLN